MFRRFCLQTFFVLLVVDSAPLARATENISTVTVSNTVGVPSTSTDGGVTFSNNVSKLTGFSTTAGNAYTVASALQNAFVQRDTSTANANQSSVWYASNSTGFAGVHQGTYGDMLKSNNFYQGADNVFSNNSSGAATPPLNTGNIERLDFTSNQALGTNLSTLAFAVFDRGIAGGHDAFTIAIVTGVYTIANADATHPVGTPSSYGGFLKIATGWGGTTNPVGDQAYNLFRYGSGNDTSASSAHGETGSQGTGGIVIKASEFGLNAGTPVYGYSLMGADVNPTAGDPLNANDTNVYPIATTDANGGIDLAAVNGLEISQVPEPSTWRLLGAGAALLSGLCLRRRSSQDLL